MKHFDTLLPSKMKPKKETVAYLLAYSKNLTTISEKNSSRKWVVCKN